MMSSQNRNSAMDAEVLSFLERNKGWNSFYADLLAKAFMYGSLTERQVAAVRRGMAKAEELGKRNQERQENAPTVDLQALVNVLATAGRSGLKKPVLQIGRFSISRAPSTGKNPGALYVKDYGAYAGKIAPDGRFLAVAGAREGVEQELVKIAADPLKAAVEHGKLTGRCACCSRKLTDEKSVQLGIGPVCRKRWGL